MAVTVIIPNYNNAQFLEQCIASVRADDAVTAIIIYDNASQDASVDIVRRLDEPKVILIEGDSNIGAAQARHHAVEHCTTDYIYFLDGDDFLDLGTVQAAYDAARRFNLDLAIPDMVRVDIDGTGRRRFVDRPDVILNGKAAFMMTIDGWKIHPMGVMRRALYIEASRQFDFHGFSDDEMLTRYMLLYASRVGGAEGAYNYRVIEKPATLAKHAGQLRTELRVLALAADLDSGSNEAVLRRLRNAAVRALAGLLRRTLMRSGDLDMVRSLHADLNRLPLPWKTPDLPYRVAATIVKLAVAGRRSGTDVGNIPPRGK